MNGTRGRGSADSNDDDVSGGGSDGNNGLGNMTFPSLQPVVRTLQKPPPQIQRIQEAALMSSPQQQQQQEQQQMLRLQGMALASPASLASQKQKPQQKSGSASADGSNSLSSTIPSSSTSVSSISTSSRHRHRQHQKQQQRQEKEMAVDVTEEDMMATEQQQQQQAKVVSPISPKSSKHYARSIAPMATETTNVGKAIFASSSNTSSHKRSSPGSADGSNSASRKVGKKTLPYKKRRPSLSTSSRCNTSSSVVAVVKKKCVQFRQDPECKRIIRKVIYGRAKLTDDERKQLWWNKQIKKSTRRAIKRYQRSSTSIETKANSSASSDDDDERDERSVTSLSRPDFFRNYQAALALCTSTSAELKKGGPLNTEDIPAISDTPIRGLEQRIFPEAVAERQKVVARVVAAQKKLPDKLTADQKSKLLRAASQNLTRKSRMLARLYGIGDENVANQALQHQQDPKQQPQQQPEQLDDDEQSLATLVI
mmetsp:Transcript_1801/g.4159  ORF Transcript_1801/g.4159 Transcript_1801/m.4159 type:complete len:482 (+) Transcript_1801:428-1873(+)